MTASVSLNPGQTTNFAGTFFVTSDGFTQGDALDDVAIRYRLLPGVLALNASVPLWGGLAITSTLAGGSSGISADMGYVLAPASTLTAATAGLLTGFTVLNQATAMVQSAQSRVPYAAAGMGINWYPLGSGARIPLKASSAGIAAWAGGLTLPNTVYWDTVNLEVTNASGSGIIGPIPGLAIWRLNSGNSRVVSYSSGTGFANWTETGNTAVVTI